MDGGTHLQHLLESGFVFLKVLYLLFNSILSTTVEGGSWRGGKEGRRGREKERRKGRREGEWEGGREGGKEREREASRGGSKEHGNTSE